MKAAVYRSPRKFEVKDIPTPKIGDNGILIKTVYCGICGTDLGSFDYGHFVKPGSVIGHEPVGIIAEVGKNVQDLQVGQRVVYLRRCSHCGSCRNCLRGLTHYCLNFPEAGALGAYAEYIAVNNAIRDVDVFPIPDEVSFTAAALVEPTTVGIRALKFARLCLNAKTVVFGAGSIGLGVGQLLKTVGACTVTQVDLSSLRLEMSAKLGVDYTLNPKEADIAKELKNLYGEEPPSLYAPGTSGTDIAFECAGVEFTTQTALETLRVGGQLVMVALAKKPLTLDIALVAGKEINMAGTFSLTAQNEYQQTMDLLVAGKIKLEEQVSHIYPLEDINEAFEMQQDTEKSIKVLVQCGNLQ